LLTKMSDMLSYSWISGMLPSVPSLGAGELLF
jgi:hypothetical protein